MATSFINEHSAELSIIPHLKMELEKSFDYVAPLFPWLNRETSNILRQVHLNDRFRILIVFPRRPKLEQDDSKSVFLTINADLLSFKEFAMDYDVPVIAGCPLSTNFWGLSKCTSHVWIEINKKTTSTYLYQVMSNHKKKDVNCLSISSIVKMINKSKFFSIGEFQEFIEESRHVMPRVFWFGPRYKPTYLLIKNR